MIHDADLDDDKFQRTECIGIDRVLKGWAKEGIRTRKSCGVASNALTRSTHFCNGDES